MSNTSMSVSVGLVGVGLCTVGLGLMFGPRDVAHASPVAAGPAEPTVVAFAVTTRDSLSLLCASSSKEYDQNVLWRMWSDGTVEAKVVKGHSIDGSLDCGGPWQSGGPWRTVPETANGYACAPDINGDRVIDGADLALVLGSWGQAPSCVALPPIECTLGQIRR